MNLGDIARKKGWKIGFRVPLGNWVKMASFSPRFVLNLELQVNRCLKRLAMVNR